MYLSSNERAHQSMIDYLRFERCCSAKIIDVLDDLRRDWFLPDDSDVEHFKPIPIGYSQTMSAPFIVASMTELLEVVAGQKVLEIGSGCGYQTAVLLKLGADVFSIEFVPELVELGKSNLEKIGLIPKIRCGDGYYGWPGEQPFDRIIIAATAPRIPEKLVDQLKIGGVMVLPVKKENREFMVRLRKTSGNVYALEWLYGVKFVPFVGYLAAN